MNRLISAKPLLATALAFGALFAASAAQARTDVVLSINAPFGYVQPQPVYVQPEPVYVQPQPVYVQPHPVYVQPQPIYYGQHRYYQRHGAWGDADRDGVPNIYDRNSRYYDGRGAHRAGGRGDADRDGVPNRYDNAPHNPYRR
jgi:hypothetical protein